jgi:hypothetical protein
MSFAHLPSIALPNWRELTVRLVESLERHLVVLLAAALLISSALMAATIEFKRTVMSGGAPMAAPVSTEAVVIDPFYESKKLAPTEDLPPQF